MIYVTRTHKLIAAAAVFLLVIVSGTLYIRQDKTTEISLGEAVELKEAAPETTEAETEILPEEISVYICGSVKNPGVVKLREGARLEEAIKMVGGTVEKADLTAVNLAYKLSDEDMVYIPEVGEKPAETAGVAAAAGSAKKGTDSHGKVNINTAGESELDTLEGIGPATAKAIIQYRDRVGAFGSIEEIKEVKGIGDAKYSSIKDSITVD
ncbi:MAG TPA: helix-hairpin-helix domain-containing protein [Clostridia bacterium]|nr:helix-hairpin-helix domain-containing protein [Clostridia bacterium]